MGSHLRLDMFAILVFFAIFFVNTGVLAVDNFGLLYGSLRTFQAHACDDNELRLNCTNSTIISINLVRYGREAGRSDLCSGSGSSTASTCRLDNALKVIEEKCRGQVICRMLISPETFREDPCPGVKKYAEVAYKCKPASFLNKIVCEGERLSLNCPEGQSLTIYSASFGTTISEVLECRQPGGVYTDCQVSYATENLMRLCNGQPRCNLLADAATFGDRTCIGRKHLKVIYNCVPRELLKQMPSTTERSSEETIHTTSFPGWARAYDTPLLNSLQKKHESVIRASTLPSNSFRSEMQSDEVPLDGTNKGDQLAGDQKIVGFMSQLMSAHKYVTGNKDRLILYVALTVGLGFLMFVTVLIARFLVVHVKSRRNSKADITQIAEDPFFSDSDLEHYDPPQVEELPLPVANYTASLRRQSSDVQPRAPVTTNGTELNHYFS